MSHSSAQLKTNSRRITRQYVRTDYPVIKDVVVNGEAGFEFSTPEFTFTLTASDLFQHDRFASALVVEDRYGNPLFESTRGLTTSGIYIDENLTDALHDYAKHIEREKSSAKTAERDEEMAAGSPVAVLQKRLSDAFPLVEPQPAKGKASPEKTISAGIRKSLTMQALFAFANLSILTYAATPPKTEPVSVSSEKSISADALQKPPVSPEQARVDALAEEYTRKYRTGTLEGIQTLQGCVSGPKTSEWRKIIGNGHYDPSQRTVILFDLGHGEDAHNPKGINYTTGTMYTKISDPNVAFILARTILEYAQKNSDSIESIQLKINDIISDMIKNRTQDLDKYNQAHKAEIKPDPFFETGNFIDRIFDRLATAQEDRTVLAREIRQVLLEKKLALTETAVIDALGESLKIEAEKQNMLVAFTRGSLDEGLDLRGMDYRPAIAYRAGMGAYFQSKGYNVLTISLHADSNPNPHHIISRTYSYAEEKDGEAVSSLAAILADNIAENYKQSDPGVSIKDPEKQARLRAQPFFNSQAATANYALPRCSVNGVLLETYQLGAYIGRIRAWNILTRPENAQFVAKSIIRGVKETTVTFGKNFVVKSAPKLAAR